MFAPGFAVLTSENNTIITNSAAEGKSKGILIDMDLGKGLNSFPREGFDFAAMGLENANKRGTYCIMHHLFLIKMLRIKSPSDVTLYFLL